jgi:hypothetical protein
MGARGSRRGFGWCGDPLSQRWRVFGARRAPEPGLPPPRLLPRQRGSRTRVVARPVLAAIATLAIALGCIAASAGGHVGASPMVSLEGVPAFGHVFLIIGENKELTRIDSTSAPYTIGTLKPASAWLTNYYALTHFSEANYVGMTSGQYTHCEQFDGSPSACHQNVDNLFHQLDVAGISWHVWAESMPKPCFLSTSGSDKTLNHYAPKHNPAIFYDDVEGSGGVWSATDLSGECLANDVPAGSTGPDDMSSLNAALATGQVPRFNFIVPNICEDGHDNCSPQGNEVRQFDDFLSREVPLIESSPAFGSDGVIIVTFDEGNSNLGPGSGQFAGGGNVMFDVLSPLVRPGVYGGTSVAYNHYSLLRTLEDGFGIPIHLGGAATARPISDIWRP